MKQTLFILLVLIFGETRTFAQVRDLPGTYTIDSCLIIAKANAGWQLPDTAQIRAMAPTLKGFAYLTRTRYEGNWVDVEMRNPLRKLIAVDMSGNEPARYSIVLVPAPK